jgi:hypothetical protein
MLGKSLALAKDFKKDGDVLALFALFDLHGLPINFPAKSKGAGQKVKHARKEILKRVGGRYEEFMRVHFAVHELEAWMLADEEVMRETLGTGFRPQKREPEEIDDNTPPSVHLKEYFRKHKSRDYIKTRDGIVLLGKIDPNRLYDKCPHFKAMVDDMRKVCAG